MQPLHINMIYQESVLPNFWIRIIDFGFRLLYNELAWTYDAVSWIASLGQWRQWQKAALPYLTGQSVLELAHGPGHMLLELELNGYNVTGIDLSPFMSRMASHRLNRNNSTVTVIRAKAQQIPLAESSFDSVLSTFPTIFIVDPATLAELHRVLRPGGKLIIVPQARLTGAGILHRLIEWLYKITGQQAVPEEAQRKTSNWFMAEELFAGAGFRIEIEHVKLEKSIVTIVIARKEH